MRYVHTIEYYWIIRRKRVLAQAATWMTLENMLSERNWSGKIIYGYDSTSTEVRVVSIETESRLAVA